MSIFCVGQAAYDITARVDEDIIPDQKYRLTTHTECPGAPALNGACVCGKWGASSYLVARIGEDAYGTMIKEQVRSCGVNLDYLLDAPGVSTSFSFIVANGKTGTRTIFNFPSQPVEAMSGSQRRRQTSFSAMARARGNHCICRKVPSGSRSS
jgi:sugar/nucleoside kinase (ribokinase family)